MRLFRLLNLHNKDKLFQSALLLLEKDNLYMLC